MEDLLAYASGPLVGFVAGFVGTLLGIGGGTIMVPVLVLLGVSVKVAAPASLVAIMGTSLGGLRRLYREGFVRVRLAAVLEAASVAGAAAGAYIFGFIGERVLEAALGVALLLSSVLIAVRARLGSGRAEGRSVGLRAGTPRLAAALAASFAAGAASAMLGIGGGVIKVPVMVLILGLPMHVAVSTSKLMVGITAATGVIEHAYFGRVEWLLGLSLLVGTFVGARTSARILISLPEWLLRIIAAGYYIFVGATILARAL